jgi:hypothetical protein
MDVILGDAGDDGARQFVNLEVYGTARFIRDCIV